MRTDKTAHRYRHAIAIVSLHAPGGLVIVDCPWLARTRSPFILVNTARADLVDEPALVAALRTDHNLHYAADALGRVGKGDRGRFRRVWAHDGQAGDLGRVVGGARTVVPDVEG